MNHRDKKDCCDKDISRGCTFCSCGEELEAKICNSCFKLHTTDWLEQMPNVVNEQIYEVRFKNTRRSYYHNTNNLPLQCGDVVAVEAQPGHDIGIISLTGDIVAKQMKRVGFVPMDGEFKKIYRKAKPYDIQRWQEAIAMEHDTMIQARRLAAEMGLDMKIGDVEYQGDRVKAIFYYIADERVDFRELIRVFAQQFRVRVEMKQIGARQEAGRIGGLGSCGRELCCASWIANFVSVTTNAARTQEISLNPQKLAGQCSKLKCCLIYEIDDYIDARREFPRLNQPLQALDGEYHLVKSDILGRTMSFSTSPNAMVGVKTLSVERVKDIIKLNKRGEKIDAIEGYEQKANLVGEAENDFVNVIGEESITRFDNSGKTESSPKPKRRARGRRGDQDAGGKQSTPNEERTKENSTQNRGKERQNGQSGGRDGRQKETTAEQKRDETTQREPRPKKSGARRGRGGRGGAGGGGTGGTGGGTGASGVPQHSKEEKRPDGAKKKGGERGKREGGRKKEDTAKKE